MSGRPNVWYPAYVALGSNLEDPRRQVETALDELDELRGTRLILASPLYRSRAVVEPGVESAVDEDADGGRDPADGSDTARERRSGAATPQPDYVNAAAAVLTRLAPETLLAELLTLEERHGRRRRPGERWAPRTLDLDLLLYAGRVVDAPGLTLPHPRIAERNFVLLPLADIAPDVMVPGRGRVGALAAAVGDRGIARLDPGKGSDRRPATRP